MLILVLRGPKAARCGAFYMFYTVRRLNIGVWWILSGIVINFDGEEGARYFDFHLFVIHVLSVVVCLFFLFVSLVQYVL